MSVVQMRRATIADVPVIVAMLADDRLGAQRESPEDLAPYARAFAVIDADPHQFLAIAEREGEIVGTMQLTVIPGLSHRGANRLVIEAVRIAGAHRGDGIGSEMIRWAIDYGRDHGCRMAQLTTDASRTDAHRFYERLGFVPSHLGFKLVIDQGD